MITRVFVFLLLAALFGGRCLAQTVTHTVTNTNGDTSSGSLGAAISNIPPIPSSDVEFSSLFNTPQAITMTSPYSTLYELTGQTVDIAAPTQLTINAAGYSVFSITGGGVLDLGNITITGDNYPYPGPTGLSVAGNSRVVVTNDSLSDGIGLNQGTLETATGLTTSSVVSLTGTDTIQVDAGQTSTFSGAISGTGTLVVSGTGTLNLGNATSGPGNSYSGGTQIAGGTLEFGQFFANVYATGTGPVTIGGGGQLIFTSTISDNIVLTAAGGSLVPAANSTVSLGSLARVAGGGMTIIPAGSFTLGTTQRIGFLTTPPTLTNGIVDASIVAANSASDTSGDFLNYTTSNGLVRATYATATAITNGVSGGTSSTSVFHATSSTNNNVATASTLYALKVDSSAVVVGAPLTLGDGTHTAGLILNGNISQAPTTIYNPIAFATGSEGSVYVGGNGTSIYADLFSQVTGSNGLTKNGNGYLIVSHAAYTGTTTINGGTLEFDNDSPLMPGQNNGVINLGSATLAYQSTFLNGTINLTGDGTIAATSGSLNFEGTINGNGHILTVSAPTGYGSILFNSQPTGISALNVSGGAVYLSGTLDSAAVPINLLSNTASLIVATNTTIANPISLTGGTLQSGPGNFSGTLALNNGTGAATFNILESESGTVTLSGSLSGTASLFVQGNGIVAVTGSSPTYSGSIVTTAADLDITGSLPKAQIQGGNVSGTGTIGMLILNQGTRIHPGELGSIGTLTASVLQWYSDGTPQLQFQLSSTTNASSLLDLGSGAFTNEGGSSTFAFDFLGTGQAGHEYDLINFGADNTNFLPTDFSATDLPAGLSATFAFVTNGDSESLEVEVIPEPATNVMLVAGLLSLAAFQLARHRRSWSQPQKFPRPSPLNSRAVAVI